MEAFIRVKDLYKIYEVGDIQIPALNGVSLSIEAGEFVSIMGSSGSGKSTLLNVIGILDNHDDGDYVLDGMTIEDLSEKKAAHLRNEMIGFIFQSFNLISFKNAMENVALPLYYKGIGRKKRNRTAMEMLERMQLAEWWHHLPNELSGGQKQRIAIARCLAQEPEIFLLDEPTASLDWRSKAEILALVKLIHDSRRLTTLFVTHDLSSLPLTCDRIVMMRDGLIWGEGTPVGMLTDTNLSRLFDLPLAEVQQRKQADVFA